MYNFFMSLTLLAGALISGLSVIPARASTDYVLEKAVEVSRHGVRPPSADNRQAIETGSGRAWQSWLTADGELTGHGYTAVWLKGRYQSRYYRQKGLLKDGCPGEGDFYLRASPMQRTRATAQALAEAAFPGCGVPVHSAEQSDPLFHYPTGKATPAEAEINRQQALQAMGGSLAMAQQRLAPQIAALKQAVCQTGSPCPVFGQPWQLRIWSNGTVGIEGLDTLAAMAETLRLEWSENKPLGQIAFGKVNSEAALVKLLPLLSYKYDYTNDLPTPSSRGASLLMSQIAGELSLKSSSAPPDVRWLLYVAHDINIAWLRTMLDFHWQQADYPPGNIPPGGSLVFERWRHHDQHFIRIYFQAQSLAQLRDLTPLDKENPPLLTELKFPGCEQTAVGTLCPYQAAMQRIKKNIRAL